MSDRTPEQVVADALHECRDLHASTNAPHVVAALRAAGLLPGPDDIVVSREDLRHALTHEADPDTWYPPDVPDCERCCRVRAALSQPHPKPEETP